MRGRTMSWKTLAILAAGLGLGAGATAFTYERKAPRYFEIRTYTANVGKMDSLHKRFRDHTDRLFRKHGIEPVGYWNVVKGEGADQTLVFVLGYPSAEKQAELWRAFATDPDWVKAKEESEKGGVLVGKVDSRFLAPADYSPLK
jgi:hypothetical protein